jgi:hypothetical protein
VSFGPIPVTWTYDPSRDPLDAAFCGRLEYALSRALVSSGQDDLKALWCDGILPPGEPPHSGWESANGSLILTSRAFIGPTGQDEYTVRLHLGSAAQAAYFRGERMDHLIPAAEDATWFHIDPDRRNAEIWIADK